MADYLKRLIRDETLLIQAATSPFMEVDKSKSGSIDEKNLTQVMTVVCASLGVTKPTTQQIKDLMKKFEKENKGKISFDEYISFLKITL